MNFKKILEDTAVSLTQYHYIPRCKHLVNAITLKDKFALISETVRDSEMDEI